MICAGRAHLVESGLLSVLEAADRAASPSLPVRPDPDLLDCSASLPASLQALLRSSPLKPPSTAPNPPPKAPLKTPLEIPHPSPSPQKSGARLGRKPGHRNVPKTPQAGSGAGARAGAGVGGGRRGPLEAMPPPLVGQCPVPGPPKLAKGLPSQTARRQPARAKTSAGTLAPAAAPILRAADAVRAEVLGPALPRDRSGVNI